MKRQARVRAGIAVAIVVIAGFSGLIANTLWHLGDTAADIRLGAEENRLWTSSRAQIAALHLARVVAQNVEGEPLMAEFSAFSDALHALAGFEPEAVALTNDLPALAGVLQGPDPRAALPLLTAFEAALAPLAGRAASRDWALIATELDRADGAMRQLRQALTGIALTGAVLIALLLLSARHAERLAQGARAARALSQQLVAGGDGGVLAVDTAQICRIWNPLCAEITGLSAQEALGRPLAQVWSDPLLGPAIGRALGGAAVHLSDVRFAAAPDRVFDLRLIPLSGAVPPTPAVLAIFWDVTARNAAQEALARSHDALEAQVAARTRALDEALARERAQGDVLRDFAAMISHQFRTPLAVMDMALQRLARNAESITPAGITVQADRARSAVARLVDVVDSTLDMARYEAGHVAPALAAVALMPLAEDCALREGLSPARLVWQADQALPPVRADARVTRLVLGNLFSNAAKYAPPDAPITVSLHALDGEVSIAVANATQIDPADVEALFTRHSRGADTAHITGTGLGLYMARTLARLQGGEVTGQVTEAAGQRQIVFTLTIPIYK